MPSRCQQKAKPPLEAKPDTGCYRWTAVHACGERGRQPQLLGNFGVASRHASFPLNLHEGDALPTELLCGFHGLCYYFKPWKPTAALRSTLHHFIFFQFNCRLCFKKKTVSSFIFCETTEYNSWNTVFLWQVLVTFYNQMENTCLILAFCAFQGKKKKTPVQYLINTLLWVVPFYF